MENTDNLPSSGPSQPHWVAVEEALQEHELAPLELSFRRHAAIGESALLHFAHRCEVAQGKDVADESELLDVAVARFGLHRSGQVLREVRAAALGLELGGQVGVSS